MQTIKRSTACTVVLALAALLVPAVASADYNRWYLRNANSTGVSQIPAFNYGDAAQTPMAGDWNADGKDTPGLFRASTANWWLSNNLAGTTDGGFVYGSPGMMPVVGDWNGNGSTSVGVKTGGTWHVSNSNSGLPASSIFTFGNPSGDIALAGDWDGNGTETPGLYRVSNHAFYLSNSPTGSLVPGIVLGVNGDVPLVGDWNGDHKDSIGVFRPSNGGWYLSNGLDGTAELVFAYGSPGDKPVVGDWDGNGTDTPGVVKILAGELYPTSTRYGGENGMVDTPGEIEAAVDYIAGDPATRYAGLMPADQERVSNYGETADGDPVVETDEETDPTEADIAGWPSEDVAEAASAAKPWRCTTVRLYHKYKAGTHWFRARWCFNRTRHKVRLTGVNETWFNGTQPWETIYDMFISDRQPNSYIDPDDGAAVVENLSEWKICSKLHVVCFSRQDRFRIRGYWNGSYRWRVNDNTATVGNPPD